MSSTRKNPYPWKVYGNSWERRGGGGGKVLKAKILEAKYEAELEFPGGSGGCETKTFRPWGGGGGCMDIFWNCTITPYSMSSSSRHLTLPKHLCELVLFLSHEHLPLCLDFIAPFNLFLS